MQRPSWRWDELAHRGTDYNDAEEVRRYDEEMAKIGDVVIEIGCGTGAFALAAAAVCRQVIAVDVSSPMLARAAEKAACAGFSNIEFHRAGFLSYEHGGEPAGAVVSSVAGRLFLMDVVYSFDEAPDSFFERLLSECPEGMRAETARHIAEEYSTTDWIMRGLLERAGFRIENAEYEQGWIARYLCAPARG